MSGDSVRIAGAHEGAAGPVLLAADPAGQVLLVSNSNGRDGVCRWDTDTGALLWRSSDALGGGNALAAVRLADGRWVVAAAGERGVARWDGLTGQVLPGCEPRDETVWGLASARLLDGRAVLVGAGNGGEIHRWDAETGIALGKPLVGHGTSVKCVAVQELPGHTVMIASGGDDGCVRRWDAATGQALGMPLEASGWVIEVVMLPLAGGRTLIAASDNEDILYRWDAESGEPIGHPVEMGEYTVLASAVHLAGEPMLFTFGADEVVRQRHAVTGEPTGHSWRGQAASCVTRADGTVLLATGAFNGDVVVQTLGVPQRSGGS
ncbi:WD40 repeat domain-containing protein [Actinacidiphila acididurans]|uniref:PQQ-binding-like beta-propeller repeat protein n=1 Tax=Actinacidiphila acididurans TaxID=2784346 RepID=A0ABS2TLY9_9ACTN|nr:PQQ-binding-like beta-propeller repeat protein [Actinacidiphila acididurans]MBM9504351.1 PQQ-binding-like beta-propeller repeat protein [Actinacidiphila acididurans]